MVAAMAGFAVEDMFLKAAAKHMPLGQALLIFGLICAAGFAAIAMRPGEGVLHPAALSATLLVRVGFSAIVGVVDSTASVLSHP